MGGWLDQILKNLLGLELGERAHDRGHGTSGLCTDICYLVFAQRKVLAFSRCSAVLSGPAEVRQAFASADREIEAVHFNSAAQLLLPRHEEP